MSVSPRARGVWLCVASCLTGASPALAQTVTYTISPAYQEGVNGAAGWFRTPVTVDYTCIGPSTLIITCPADEVIGASGSAKGPFVREMTYSAGPPSIPGVTPLTLETAQGSGVPLAGVDQAPPEVSVSAPRSGSTYDAASTVNAAYVCRFAESTQSPGASCVGTVPAATPFDTGVLGNPATWGAKTFTVTATDVAGNSAVATVPYSVEDFPAVAAFVSPTDKQQVTRRPTFTWTPPGDLGTGFSMFRLFVMPKGRSATAYELRTLADPMTFTVPRDLPAGEYSWRVDTIDTAGHTAKSTWRPFTVVVTALPAAPVVSSPSASTETRPTFRWTAEAGATSEWMVVQGSRTVVPATVTTQSSAQVPTALAVGAYAFRVRQSTPFGGTGPWSADFAFTVTTPPPVTVAGNPTVARPGNTASALPLPTSAPGAPAGTALRYPTVRPSLLKPRAGTRSRTLRPVLAWKGVRGASLYNLQIFRVQDGRYVKVAGLFPRASRYRLGRRVLVPGQVYVWRVWPYLRATKRYAVRPVGVSWFRTR